MNNSEYYVNNNKYNYCTTIPNRISPCLRRDSYLSEFWSEEEKKLARDNLGITEIIDELRNLILNKLMGNNISLEELTNILKEYVKQSLLKTSLDEWINGVSARIAQDVINSIKENENFITLDDSVANTNTKVGGVLQYVAYNKNDFDKLLQLDVDLFHPAPINSTNGDNEEAAMTQKATKDYVDSSIQDIEVINKNSTLKWNQEETIATINGSDIKVKLPEKPTVGRVENETLIVNSVIELITNGSYELTDNKTSSSNKSNTKLYLIGAISQSNNGIVTYSNNSVYINSDNNLYVNDKKVINDIKNAIESLNDSDKQEILNSLITDENDLINSLLNNLSEENLEEFAEKIVDAINWNEVSSKINKNTYLESVAWPEDLSYTNASTTEIPNIKLNLIYSNGDVHKGNATIVAYTSENGNEIKSNWYKTPGTYWLIGKYDDVTTSSRHLYVVKANVEILNLNDLIGNIEDGQSKTITFNTNVLANIELVSTGEPGKWTVSKNLQDGTSHTITITNLTSSTEESIIEPNTIKVNIYPSDTLLYNNSENISVQRNSITLLKKTESPVATINSTNITRPIDINRVAAIEWENASVDSPINSGETGNFDKGKVYASYENTNKTTEIITSNFENNPIITSSNTDVITIGQIIKNGSTTITAVGAGLAIVTVKDGLNTVSLFTINVTNSEERHAVEDLNGMLFIPDAGSINSEYTKVTAPNVTSDTPVTISAKYGGKTAAQTVSYTAIAVQQTTYYFSVGTTAPTTSNYTTVNDATTTIPTTKEFTNNSGSKSYIYIVVPSNKTITATDLAITSISSPLLEYTTVTIPNHKIYVTDGKIANGGGIKITIS